MEHRELEAKSIGSISNLYGGLHVRETIGKFFWSIENWDGFEWEEIPESLYRELLAFEEKREAIA
jgi:hypothetical protein